MPFTMYGALACCLATLSLASAGPPPPPPPSPSFDATLDDYAVLQQTPSSAFVYGATSSSSVTVTVSGAGCASMTVKATVFNHTWKAAVPGAKGGDCTIVATDDTTGNHTNLSHVTYGDVWYCGGQSNMALPIAHTFSRNITAKAVMAGKYVEEDPVHVHLLSPSPPAALLALQPPMHSSPSSSSSSSFSVYTRYTCIYTILYTSKHL